MPSKAYRKLRPRKVPTSRYLSVKFPAAMVKAIEAQAAAKSVTRSEAMRLLIEVGLRHTVKPRRT